MLLLIKLAARNIIKQKRRSLAILLTIIISISFMQLALGFLDGFIIDFMNTAFDNIGHITMHAAGYSKKTGLLPLKPAITNYKEIISKLQKNQAIIDINSNITYGSLLVSDVTNLTMLGKGIDPTQSGFKHFAKAITKGRFLTGPHEIVFGEAVAQLIKVSVGDEVLLLTNDLYDSFAAGTAEVVGLFKTGIASEDEYNMFTYLTDTQTMLGLEGTVTEINLKLTNPALSLKVLKKIKPLVKKYNLEAAPWQKTSKFISAMLKAINFSMIIFLGIIFTVAGTSIINIMLTAVFERTREIGTLRAIGFSKKSILFMFLTEATILGCLGSLIGCAIGTGLVFWFYYHPAIYQDISELAAGMGNIFRAGFTWNTLFTCFMTGLTVPLAGALYPAYLAIKMKPIEALRKRA